MDETRFKQTKTQRGFTYSYYFAAPSEGKPTLFFAHGFPTPAYLWRHQVAFLEPLGFGIVAPNLLGYGGTDKPTDAKFYIGSGLAQDIVDILDEEGIQQVIAVCHDWGTHVVSRMVNFHPGRLLACAFLGVGYVPPASSLISQSQQMNLAAEIGYDVFAFHSFFREPEAPVLMEKNFDSFFSLMFPVSDGEIWTENMCVAGKAKEWVETNRTTELPSYITPEDKGYYRKVLVGGGLRAPLCWYRLLVTDANAEDDATIPQTAYTLNKPVLFVAFNKDPIGLPLFGLASHAEFVKPETNLTNKALEGDHWAVLSHAEELNGMLLEWVERLKL
ncbi:alpha/beta-hydrolase [Mycena amicta]|nr:alpha/beta-hydrolase [Mycena amicta]